MIDTTAGSLAFRNRALGLVVVTTGTMALAATTTGYTRIDGGSFVTDGFVPGMEVTPSGFASNVVDIITRVQAATLTVLTARSAEASDIGRTLQVKVPANRYWENVVLDPPGGRPYLEGEFVPATLNTISLPARTAELEETGLYVFRWNGLQNYPAGSIHKCVDALAARFTPGTQLTAGSHTILIASQPGPRAGQILPRGDGWSTRTLSIPWRARSTNAVAA